MKYNKIVNSLENKKSQEIMKNISFIQTGTLNPKKNTAFTDNGIKEFLTEYKLKQYLEGKMSKEKAIENAIKQMIKIKQKEFLSQYRKLEVIEDTKTVLQSIDIYINQYSNSVRTEFIVNKKKPIVYNSLDTNIANNIVNALNKCYPFLKLLCEYKENSENNNFENWEYSNFVGSTTPLLKKSIENQNIKEIFDDLGFSFEFLCDTIENKVKTYHFVMKKKK